MEATATGSGLADHVIEMSRLAQTSAAAGCGSASPTFPPSSTQAGTRLNSHEESHPSAVTMRPFH